MSKLLSDLWRDVRKASHAFSCADLGEHLTGLQKDRALDVPATPIYTPDLSKPRKHVAHIASAIRPGALRYAIGISQRMDADLDILSPPGAAGVERALDFHRSDLERSGVRWRHLWERLTGPRDIASYVQAHRDVLFIVVSAQDAIVRNIAAGPPPKAPADVPWVLVTEDLALA